MRFRRAAADLPRPTLNADAQDANLVNQSTRLSPVTTQHLCIVINY